MFEVVGDIPSRFAQKGFYDLLAAGWGSAHEDPVGALESLGIGFLWRSKVGGRACARLPLPWALIRNGLEARGFLSPKAHVYMTRSEIQRVSGSEQPRLIVSLERS